MIIILLLYKNNIFKMSGEFDFTKSLGMFKLLSGVHNLGDGSTIWWSTAYRRCERYRLFSK